MLRLQIFFLLFASIAVDSLAVTGYGNKLYPTSSRLEPCNSLYGTRTSSLIICVPNGLSRSETINAVQQKTRKTNTASTGHLNQPRSFVTARHQLQYGDNEYMAYPRYTYNYGVLDGGTGDTKSAWEERNGDTVRGAYSILEPDGTLRTVTYTADDKNGFKAVITKSRPRMTRNGIVRWS